MFISFFALSYCVEYTGYVDDKLKVTVEEGTKKDGQCWGNYKAELNITGWYQLLLEGKSGLGGAAMGKCVGYLEGYMAQKDIYNAINLFMDSQFENRSLSDEKFNKLNDWMTENLKYAREYSENESNEQAKQYKVFINIFTGLVEGYNDVAPEDEKIPELYFWMYSANGDLYDIMPLLGLMKYDDFHRARCTGLIRLLPDYSDIFMSHNSWTDYRQLHGVLKQYILPLSYFRAQSVVLSTRLGQIGSLDDFYISDSNLMVFETTIMNQNVSYGADFMKPKAINYWIRALTAMFCAKGGRDWIDIFMLHNSGTYNNDYYIIDIEKLAPGEQPKSDLVWLVEQTPTDNKYYYDMTENLTTNGYLESFNVPRTKEIYDLMDYASHQDNALFIEFTKNPRYLIAERELPKVQNFDQFKALGRFNQYLHDEYSHGDPLASLAARNDLNTSINNSDFLLGSLDNKAVRASEVFTRLHMHAVNSPTNTGDCPNFTWNFDRLKDVAHDGLPEVMAFEYIERSGKDADICAKITDENDCIEAKYCGWCDEPKRCMAGNDYDGSFYDKCDGNYITRATKEREMMYIIIGSTCGILVILIIIIVIVCCIQKNKKRDDVYLITTSITQ